MPNVIQPNKQGQNRPAKDLHPQHPFNHERNHDRLREYVMSRVRIGLNYRDSVISRYVKVDKQISGYLDLSDTDKLRESKRSATGQQLAVEVNLPLTHIHIDDMATYIAETSAPMRGIYHAVDDADEQDVANAVAAEMNRHAHNSDHFSAITRSGLSALKYNICCLEVEWHKQFRPSFEEGKSVPVLAWEGNQLNHMNMYNTFWDTCVTPQDVPIHGEYAGKVTRISAFTLKRLVDSGVYGNVEKVNVKQKQVNSNRSTDDGSLNYYKDVAAEVGLQTGNDSTGKETSGDTNWLSFLGVGEGVTAGTAVELIHTYIWLNPYDMNLVPKNKISRDSGRNTFELWKVIIAGGEVIVKAELFESKHGFIPMAFGAINYDDLGVAQRSVAEIIDPLQVFASFALNTHVQATRSNIWDLTVYDPSVVDFSEIPEGEVAARIPVKEAGQGKDINTAIWQNGNLIDTRQTVEDMKMIMELLQTFYPTQSLPNQVAGIDRAIESQVAAVTQGSTRRMKQAVRVLDSTLYRMSRMFQYYNLIQFQTKPLPVRGKTGEEAQIQVGTLKQITALDALGQGLKTMDKEAVASQLATLTQMVLQSPNAVQQTDIMTLIDAVSNYMGIEVDFKQFRIQQPTQGAAGDATENTGEAAPTGTDLGAGAI